MTGFGERLVVTTGRLCAWLVVCAPVSVVAIIAYAAMQVRDRPTDVSYIAPVAMTLVIAGVSAFMGVALGALLAFANAQWGFTFFPDAVRMIVTVLGSFPPVVLGWLAWVLIIPAAYGVGASHSPRIWMVPLGAILVLTVLVIPQAFGAVLRALAHVPEEIRAAAAAAGANRAQVATEVLMPLVARTVWAAIALGFARATGEAAAVTLVFVASALYQWPLGGVVLGTSIISAGSAGSSAGLVLLGQAAAAGLVLTTFGFMAVIVANRFDRRIAWS